LLARISILRAMARLFGMVLRWSLIPILIFFSEAMASELWLALASQAPESGSHLRSLALWTAGGLAFRILFHGAMRRMGRDDPMDFIDTLEHELTHALAGYATLSPPVSLSASLKAGGEVQLKGSNPIAALAPYFLPLWCALILVSGLVIQQGIQAAWDRLLFFMLGWFCYRLFREYRWRQTDLHLYGFVFSTLCVFNLLLACLAVILEMRDLLSWTWVPEACAHAWKTLNLALGRLGLGFPE
jgi:hypothetical protein